MLKTQERVADRRERPLPWNIHLINIAGDLPFPKLHTFYLLRPLWSHHSQLHHHSFLHFYQALNVINHTLSLQTPTSCILKRTNSLSGGPFYRTSVAFREKLKKKRVGNDKCDRHQDSDFKLKKVLVASICVSSQLNLWIRIFVYSPCFNKNPTKSMSPPWEPLEEFVNNCRTDLN